MVYTNKAYKAYDVKYIESFNIEHFKAIQKGYDIERQLLRITTVRLLVLYVISIVCCKNYTIHHTPYTIQLTAYSLQLARVTRLPNAL
jgi:hypothetical protein